MYIEIIIRYIIILLIGKETNNERLTLPNEGSTILIILIIGNPLLKPYLEFTEAKI